ncbi:thioredoxin [uncultured Cohaesibacter sp.]|uniref:thioredoxin n=1 Tax=uncultured Cohaesibacter sp. TaxID=1002546 RepID=UPI0029C8C9F6|nr:thioredoxin [uncultured Cohaesibacter sp.]
MSNNTYGYGSGMSANYTTTQGSGSQSFGAAPTSAPKLAPRPQKDTGPLIKDTTTQEFMKDVIEASRSTTILVDFWAPWCGPCKQLAPALEKAVTEAKGRVKLVKLNIDDHPAIPQQMGIQSVPAVVAFKDGRPVDGFMGAQPASQIKAFIDKNGTEPEADPLDKACEQATDLLKAGNVAEAVQLFAAILQQVPDHIPAIVGLANGALALEQVDRARAIFDSLPEESLGEKDVIALKASLELAEQSADLGDLAELQAKLDANPEDNQAQFDLAIALNGKNRREEAVDQLIAIIKRDREWNEDGARKQLLQFFESWGVMDPSSVYGRRQLSSILFA